MNLKTHTTYPEIQISEPNKGNHYWIAQLIDGKGKVCEAFKGKSSSHQLAVKEALVSINNVKDKYLIK